MANLIDISPVFAARLATNRGLVPDHPERRVAASYGVHATYDGETVELRLTFRSGSAYCCSEWGCHIGLHSHEHWRWLRHELATRGGGVPARLRVRITVLVEDGAMFFDYRSPDRTRRGWYAFKPGDACSYEVVKLEERPATA